MKRIFTLSFLVLGLAVLLGACTKRGYYGIDEEYWLHQERGVVVYSSPYCDFFAVETNYGYTIIRGTGGSVPFEGDIIYGDFSHYGYNSFYNRTEGRLTYGTVTDFWLDYFSAEDRIDFYCY